MSKAYGESRKSDHVQANQRGKGAIEAEKERGREEGALERGINNGRERSLGVQGMNKHRETQ